MTRIVIAGAGGFGRGVHSWLTQSPKHIAEFDVTEIVYIDDTAPAQDPRAPIISRIPEYRPRTDDRVMCAIGSSTVRRRVVDALTAKDVVFHTFVDDRTVVGIGSEVLGGAIICPGSVLSSNVVVGQHVHINFNCSVGHDTVLGAYSTLSPMVNVMGEVKVGESAFFGGSSTVLPRISIGSAATIAAGATVTSSVPSGRTVVGTPARELPLKENR